MIITLVIFVDDGIATWKYWPNFFKFQSIPILAIRSNRRQETVSVPKDSL